MNNISTISDNDLVEIVCSGNKESFAEIIHRYQNKLLRYATYLVGDDQLAADIVQDSFLKSYVNLQSFNNKKKFSSWIYRIVHNEAINLINKNKKRFLLNEEIDYDSGIDLEEDLIKKQLIQKTHDCLKDMPLIYREPLSLYYLEEKTYEEISDILRLPVNTVGTRVSRAKKIMKAICEKTII